MSQFIVRKPQSSNKTIRMPNDLLAEMDKIANEKDVSFNQLVIQCCRYALENMEKEPEKE